MKTQKGFIPIIFIIIGAVAIASIGLGIVYKDKLTASVASLFKRTEVNEVNTEQEQQIQELQKAEKEKQAQEVETEQQQLTTQPQPKQQTLNQQSPSQSQIQTQAPTQDQQTTTNLATGFVDWINYYENEIIKPNINLLNNLLPFINERLGLLNGLINIQSAHIGSSYQPTGDELLDLIYQYSIGYRNLLIAYKNVYMGVKTDIIPNTINSFNEYYNKYEKVKAFADIYTTDQIKTMLTKMNSDMSFLNGDTVKFVRDFLSNDTEMMNEIKTQNSNMLFALNAVKQSLNTQSVPVKYTTNMSDNYSDYLKITQEISYRNSLISNLTSINNSLLEITNRLSIFLGGF